MQPYQEATEEIIRQKEAPYKAAGKVIGTAASLASGSLGTAATLAGGSALFNKIKPFLSNHIPQDLTIKALSKIDPRLGKFVGSALKNGYNKEEIGEFLKEKVEPEKKENAQDNRNIIEQYSPELHEFIKEEVTKGRSPIEAGALAQLNNKFKSIIKKLEQDHKSPFSALLQTVYGGGQYGGAVNPPQQAPQQMQQQAQPQPQGQQSVQGQQALMAIMQKINQKLGG